MADDEDKTVSPKPEAIEIHDKNQISLPAWWHRASRWPWVNAQQKRTLESIKNTAESYDQLLQATIRTRRTEETLRDLPIILATDHLARQNAFDDAKRSAELSKLKDEVERKQLENQIGQLDREKGQLEAAAELAKRATPGAARPKPKTQAQQHKELREEWEAMEKELRAAGLSEDDEAWKLARNDHENRLRRIFQQ